MEVILHSPAISQERRQLRRDPRLVGGADGRREIGLETNGERDVLITKSEADAASKSKEDAIAHLKATVMELEKQLENMRLQYDSSLEQARKEAEKRGHSAGFEKGQREAVRILTDQMGRLTSVCMSIDNARREAVDCMEDVMVEMVYGAICKILGESIFTREAIVSTVQHALQVFHKEASLKVHLHPKDFSLIQGIGAETNFLNGGASISFASDIAVELGGCIIESPSGSIDARLETQLSRLRDILLSIRSGREGIEGKLA